MRSCSEVVWFFSELFHHNIYFLPFIDECGSVSAGVPHLLPVNIAGCYGNHCGLPHEPGQERSDPKRGPVNPATQKDAAFCFFKGVSVQL